jgi:TupA-like ATPgrasp
VTFTDKVRHKILGDRRPVLKQWADKVAVRAYVESKVGREFLTELYRVTDDPEQLTSDALPREFALKPSHGSGACVIVGDQVKPEQKLPPLPVGWALLQVAPDSLDWDRLRSISWEWLGLRFREGLEWAYRHVPARILVEELLLDRGSLPPDYKFFVFHGRARLVQVDTDRFQDHRRDLFRPDWEPVDVQYKFPRSGLDIARPQSLDRMLEVAEALGEDTDFIRVDLYDIAGRVVVGELTNYPGGGRERFRPDSFDTELGAWWTPPTRYR